MVSKREDFEWLTEHEVVTFAVTKMSLSSPGNLKKILLQNLDRRNISAHHPRSKSTS